MQNLNQLLSKKFRTFVIEIFELVNLIRIDPMSLEDIKRYFRNYNISITGELISKISKLKLEKEKVIEKNLDINS